MLRRLLIPVLLYPKFPLKKNSRLDVSLLRASHHALIRQQQGFNDSFLFVLCGCFDGEAVAESIVAYGFPDVKFMIISERIGELINGTEEYDPEMERQLIEFERGQALDRMKEQAGTAISRWVEEHHPAATGDFIYDGYDSLDIWWSGDVPELKAAADESYCLHHEDEKDMKLRTETEQQECDPVQAFLAYLDERLERMDKQKLNSSDSHIRAILETEAAELCGIRIAFKEIFRVLE